VVQTVVSSRGKTWLFSTEGKKRGKKIKKGKRREFGRQVLAMTEGGRHKSLLSEGGQPVHRRAGLNQRKR